MDHDEERKVIVNVPVTLNFNGVEIKTLLDTVTRIAADVLILKSQGAKIMADIDVILQDVADESTVADSILALVNTLVANQNDPAKLKAIITGLNANKAKLLAAIAAGTPVTPPPPSITVTPASVSVAVGATQQLAVSDGTKDVTAQSAFTSGDATIATVDASGLVTGVAAGSTSVGVSEGTASTVVPVTVA